MDFHKIIRTSVGADLSALGGCSEIHIISLKFIIALGGGIPGEAVPPPQCHKCRGYARTEAHGTPFAKCVRERSHSQHLQQRKLELRQDKHLAYSQKQGKAKEWQ